MAKVKVIREDMMKNLRKSLEEDLKGRFSEGDSVCVKAHMGEYGNLNYLRPPIIGVVVEVLKNMGAKPFLFDTPVAYPSSRKTEEGYLDTARRHGFTEETVGCPVIISNEGKEVESRHTSKLLLAKRLVEADGLVVVSHFKGHSMTNFGGAIKNIGMGAVTRESKRIMHDEAQAVVGEGCTGCGTCVPACPNGAIKVKDGKAVIDYGSCYGCCACVEVCPAGAMKAKSVPFSRSLGESAALVLKEFGPRKTFFINVAMDITRRCDCGGYSGAGDKVMLDVGMLTSESAPAIDKASLDLADKASGGTFSKIYKSRLHEQFESLKDNGAGDSGYELEEVK